MIIAFNYFNQGYVSAIRPAETLRLSALTRTADRKHCMDMTPKLCSPERVIIVSWSLMYPYANITSAMRHIIGER